MDIVGIYWSAKEKVVTVRVQICGIGGSIRSISADSQQIAVVSAAGAETVETEFFLTVITAHISVALNSIGIYCDGIFARRGMYDDIRSRHDAILCHFEAFAAANAVCPNIDAVFLVPQGVCTLGEIGFIDVKSSDRPACGGNVSCDVQVSL